MAIHQSPPDSIAIIWWQTKWIWSPPLDGNQNHFGHHHRMETKKGGIWQTPFYLFRFPTRMGNLKKYGRHPIVIIFPMVTKVFELPKKGAMPHVLLEPFDNSWWELSKNIWQAPFCGDWKQFAPHWKSNDTRTGDWRNLVILLSNWRIFANLTTIEIFSITLFCGDWNFLVAIEGGRVICFWRAFDKGF